MGSKVITFRIPEEVYEEFARKCSNDGVKPAERLREFVDNVCYPSKAEEKDASEDWAKPNGSLQPKLEDIISRVEAIEDISSRVETIEEKRRQMYEALTTLVKELEYL